MFDLDAYLQRIGLDGRPGLAELHRAHLAAIVFENLDPHRGIPVSLAPDFGLTGFAVSAEGRVIRAES
jgi:N-hydroxyarylamine O-acetyltransferase